MQTLIPSAAEAQARPLGRLGGWLGFGLTVRSLLLLAFGLLLAAPAFYHPRAIGFMLGWDGLVLAAVLVDRLQLPAPRVFTVQRRFVDSPQLGVATRVELGLRMEADAVLDLRVVDDLHPALVGEPAVQRVEIFPREEVVSESVLYPRQRGDYTLGRVFLRYRSGLGLVERWAWALPATVAERVVDPAARRVGQAQRVRVYPAHQDSRESTAFYLLRARQIELQKRKLRLRGTGREFESLREYQPGDELRNISWTATARRGHLVTRQFTVERSQQVWVVVDAGRLSRTAFELRRGGSAAFAETAAERTGRHLLTVTQLDQATTAATMLAQVIDGSGDKFALLTYGRQVQQLLPPGSGAGHLRVLLDLLSQTRSEAAEADALNAVARLKTLQRRRGLVVWITELVDTVGRPEIARAAAELVRQHLVVLIVLRHPELEALAARRPQSREQMFHSAAAEEMLERRRETIARMQQQGVLIVETTAEEIGVRAVSQYLEVKAEGLL